MNAIAMLMPAPDDVTISVATFDSPLGVLRVACMPAGVCAVAFDDRREALEPRLRRMFGPFFHIEYGDPLGVGMRLDEYFNGHFTSLDAVPRAVPATPMQRRVWSLVGALPAGTTTSYAAIADRIGMPRAQRAVGVCCASNPVPLFVPCHRVIAASGALASHPGGTIRKRWLLRHEGAFRDCGANAARRRFATPSHALDPAEVVHLVVPRLAR